AVELSDEEIATLHDAVSPEAVSGGRYADRDIALLNHWRSAQLMPALTTARGSVARGRGSASAPPFICTISYIPAMASTWSALVDPHRRAVLTLLLDRPRPVGELVERLGLTQPGTSKHLRILREAGLVRVRTEAQRRVYELRPGPLAELDAWLAPYRQLWDSRRAGLEGP